MGGLNISDAVIRKIAAYSALDVEGIANLGGFIDTETVRSVSEATLDKAVHVVRTDSGFRISINVVCTYGSNMIKACKSVQYKVRMSVQNMSGLTVEEVNVTVCDVAGNI